MGTSVNERNLSPEFGCAQRAWRGRSLPCFTSPAEWGWGASLWPLIFIAARRKPENCGQMGGKDRKAKITSQAPCQGHLFAFSIWTVMAEACCSSHIYVKEKKKKEGKACIRIFRLIQQKEIPENLSLLEFCKIKP